MDLIMEGWAPTEVADFAVASRLYIMRRDDSDMGARGFPSGYVATPGGTRIARISYNGRVWNMGRWKPDDTPIWDSKDPDAHPAGFPDMPKRTPTLEEQDRIDAMHHHASRIRTAIRAIGIRLTHEDAAHLLAKANGRRNANAYRRDVVAGETMAWSHHAAATAVRERLFVSAVDARRAADAAARSIRREVVTITGLHEMTKAAPGLARMPIPFDHADEAAMAAMTAAGLTDVGDLLAKADQLDAGTLDGALEALTRAKEPEGD